MLKVIMSKYPVLLVMAAGVLAFIAVLVFTGGAVRASERDDRIESSFKKSYVYNTYLKDEDIQIRCKNGAVTLSGAVAIETHKPMAQSVAGALPGVTSVDNRITVKGERPAKSPDMWISMKVKAALLYRRNVSGTQTKVYVKDGVVTLKGVAANQAQKDLTTVYAKNIAGVKGVQNEIVASKGPEITGNMQGEKFDDGPTTARIKGSLVAHRSTIALNTAVATNDDAITARGPGEKTPLTKLVTDVNTVQGVVNNTTIVATASSNN